MEGGKEEGKQGGENDEGREREGGKQGKREEERP